MNAQLPLCVPAEGGLEVVLPKLYARTEDPAPSKRAAAKLDTKAISKSRELFCYMLREFGPSTVREAAAHTKNPEMWNYEWQRRVKQWHVAGHIEIVREDLQGRVWRVK